MHAHQRLAPLRLRVGLGAQALIQQLRGLEKDGVVTRTLYPQVPPRVEYALTELGRGLGPVFLALLDWAQLRRASPGGGDVDRSRTG